MPRPEVAVGAVIVRGGRLLMIQRGRGVGAGRWSLPGGRVESGETLAVALEREVREETGLTARIGQLCGIAERIGSGAHYVIVDYWADADGTPVAGDDAAAVTWADRDTLQRLDLVDHLLEFLDDHGVLACLDETR